MTFKTDRILAIRLSAVGDVINTLPAIEALRETYPRSVIGFAVEDRVIDLIRNHPSIDRVHLFRRRRWVDMWFRPGQWGRFLAEFIRFWGEIRAEHYDVVLDLQGNLKGALHGILSGSAVRVGFSRGHSKEGNHLFATHHVRPPGGETINRVEKFLAMASFIGARVEGAGYRLPEPEDSRERVSEFLARNGIGPYAVIHPGTSHFGRLKRWMPDRFASLARRLGHEHALPSLITWGPGERELALEVVAAADGFARLAPETRNLLDLAEIIRRASLFVGCDSGPLHLSSAVSTPSVALFGPKDPRTYGPYNPKHRVVYKESGNGSMGAITVEDAFDAAADLLAMIK